MSDHFHPWNDQQGHSPFVWSVIGALSQACSLPVTTAVTCLIMRIHPAVIAQAAATCAAQLPRTLFHCGAASTRCRRTLPLSTSPIYVSAFGPRAVRWPGRIGDGFQSTMPELVSEFHEAGGAGKPTQAGFKVCHSRTKEDGVAPLTRCGGPRSCQGS
ncbi:MAG TPA: hypothetical protein VEF72_22460 [Mycobacterium sp.]|nr:hypothetical protein [Mycobacterium sp.]